MNLNDVLVVRCVVCSAPIEQEGIMTCSSGCHEEFIRRLERQFGTHKRITRMRTGETFLVPVRDIVEKGVKEQELDRYPRAE